MSRLLPALLLLVPAAWAQDDKPAAPAMPSPKHAEHEPLASFVGTWDCAVKIVQDGKAEETSATETFELLCNGTWLKSTVDGTFRGEPFQGISLMGYDPTAKCYVGLWADSLSSSATRSSITHDAKSKTWTSKKVSGEGAERTVLTWQGPDSFVETAYGTGPDGKENVMEIKRTRAKGATTATAVAGRTMKAAAPAAAANTQPADLLQSEWTRCLGEWNATSRMPGPDGNVQEDKGKETCVAVCAGRWQWVHYSGSSMGQPFEGYGLVGYDPASKQTTTYWFDSTSPFLATLEGRYDPAIQGVSCSGSCRCPDGQDMTMATRSTWKDANTRVTEMTCTSKDMTMKWEIEYSRATPGSKAK